MFWYLRAVSSFAAPYFLSNVRHLLLNVRQASRQVDRRPLCELEPGTLLQFLAELSFGEGAVHCLDNDAGDLVWVAVGSCLIVSNVATL